MSCLIVVNLKVAFGKDKKSVDLTSIERLVLMMLALYGNKDGSNIFPSDSTLADDCNLTREHVCRIKSKLCKKGWLKVIEAKHRKTKKLEFDLNKLKDFLKNDFISFDDKKPIEKPEKQDLEKEKHKEKPEEFHEEKSVCATITQGVIQDHTNSESSVIQDHTTVPLALPDHVNDPLKQNKGLHTQKNTYKEKNKSLDLSLEREKDNDLVDKLKLLEIYDGCIRKLFKEFSVSRIRMAVCYCKEANGVINPYSYMIDYLRNGSKYHKAQKKSFQQEKSTKPESSVHSSENLSDLYSVLVWNAENLKTEKAINELHNFLNANPQFKKQA
jgi:hypothetical protein